MHKILVIDDEEDFRFLVCNMLERKGYEVEAAGSISGAKKQLESFSPDLVLLDVILPDGVGYSMINPIKNKDKETEIVICSAYNQEEDMESAREKGVSMFINKPLNKEKIDLILERIQG